MLVVMDTVRADAVGMLAPTGTPVTPHVDALAREGIRWVNAFTPAPWTVPAHASLFTGLYPHQHMAVHERFRLAARFTTMAETLKETGYETAGFTCNPWLHGQSGMGQGFDRYEEIYRLARPEGDQGAEQATALICAWLRRRPRPQQPFFLFVNYMEAHLPYRPPGRVLERLGHGKPYPFAGHYSVEGAERHIAGLDVLTEPQQRQIAALYQAEVAYVDDQIGALVTALRETGYLENTMIVVTSDHGEHLGDHQLAGHEFSLYEAVLRIPLVMRLPAGKTGGRTVSTPVSLTDVLPTVLDILGKLPAGLAGNSLLWAQGEAGSSGPRPMLAEYSRPRTLIRQHWGTRYPDLDLSRYDVGLQAVRRGNVKYIASERGEERLFDLGSDPGEQRNLTRSAPDQLDAMRGMLEAMLRPD